MDTVVDLIVIRSRHLFRIAALVVVAGALVAVSGCFGGDDASCPDPTMSVKGLGGSDGAGIAPGQMVEVTGARFLSRCDGDDPVPLKGLSMAVVQDSVDINVAGVAADGDGAFVVTFGLPENLPAGPAEFVVRGTRGADDVLATATIEVAPPA